MDVLFLIIMVGVIIWANASKPTPDTSELDLSDLVGYFKQPSGSVSQKTDRPIQQTPVAKPRPKKSSAPKQPPASPWLQKKSSQNPNLLVGQRRERTRIANKSEITSFASADDLSSTDDWLNTSYQRNMSTALDHEKTRAINSTQGALIDSSNASYKLTQQKQPISDDYASAFQEQRPSLELDRSDFVKTFIFSEVLRRYDINRIYERIPTLYDD